MLLVLMNQGFVDTIKLLATISAEVGVLVVGVKFTSPGANEFSSGFRGSDHGFDGTPRDTSLVTQTTLVKRIGGKVRLIDLHPPCRATPPPTTPQRAISDQRRVGFTAFLSTP